MASWVARQAARPCPVLMAVHGQQALLPLAPWAWQVLPLVCPWQMWAGFLLLPLAAAVERQAQPRSSPCQQVLSLLHCVSLAGLRWV